MNVIPETCRGQFLNNVIINKTKALLSQEQVIVADFGYPVQTLWLAFQSFDFERT